MTVNYGLPRTLSGWTMFIFGFLALLLGLVGLVQPEATLALLGIDVIEQANRGDGDYTLMFVTASSMASFNMGVYYILASFIHWKPFFLWTVPFRMVTFVVFVLAVSREIAPTAFLGVAVWELAGALLTGAALLWERGRETAA